MKKCIIAIGIIGMILMQGCSSDKSWGAAGSADAFDLTVSNPQSGVMTPSLVAGGGCFSVLFIKEYEKDAQYPRAISYSRRRSLWNVFSSASASNVSCVYISSSGETPAQTAEILRAFAEIVNDDVQSITNTTKTETTEVK